MKFEVNEGCVHFSFIIDGVEYENYPIANREKIVDHVLASLKQRIMLGNASLMQILDNFPQESYKCGDKCEQCGDTPCTTIYEI